MPFQPLLLYIKTYMYDRSIQAQHNMHVLLFVHVQMLAFECAVKYRDDHLPACYCMCAWLYLPSSLLTSVLGCELMSMNKAAWSVMK